MALSYRRIMECRLTGDRGRDDGHIYESILSLLISHSHSIADGLETLVRSIREALFIRSRNPESAV